MAIVMFVFVITKNSTSDLQEVCFQFTYLIWESLCYKEREDESSAERGSVD